MFFYRVNKLTRIGIYYTYSYKYLLVVQPKIPSFFPAFSVAPLEKVVHNDNSLIRLNKGQTYKSVQNLAYI